MSARLGWGPLAGLRPTPPIELLRRLHARAAAQRLQPAAALPRVRIDDHRGRAYEGCVLAIEERRDDCLVLLRGAAPGDPLVSLQLEGPFHLTVYDAPDEQSLFSAGAPPRWSEDEPLSALQLRRTLAAEAARYGSELGLALDATGVAVADADPGNNVVRDLVEALRTHLASTRADAVGADALRSIARVVVRSAGGALRCRREADALVVELDPARGLGARAELGSLVDAAL